MDNKRTPIGKTVRFEVFKRDGFACAYCGSHPPVVVLEVDHINPVALGGDNDPDNLVTACFNCNRGKAARPLTSVPQSLAEKAQEIAEREAQIAGYQAVLQARRDRVEDQIWEVVRLWTGEETTSHTRYEAIKNFIGRLGIGDVLDAVDITLAANIRSDARQLRYFCGVCWNKVADAAGRPR